MSERLSGEREREREREGEGGERERRTSQACILTQVSRTQAETEGKLEIRAVCRQR